MAIQHNRVTIGGALYGSEKWACAFHFGNGTAALASFADLTSAASQIATALAALDGSSPTNAVFVTKTGIAQLQHVDVAVLADGVVANTGTANLAPTGGGSGNLPPQTALVTSLLTDINDRSHRGRIYMPALNSTQSIAGLWTGSAATYLSGFASIANIMSEKLAGVGGGDLAVFALAVFSKLHMNLSPVTRLRVNNVFDTQRRRSWSIPPVNTVVNYTVA